MNHHRIAVSKQFIELLTSLGIFLDDLDVHIVGRCERCTDSSLVATHHNHILHIGIVLLTDYLTYIGDIFLSGHEVDEVANT